MRTQILEPADLTPVRLSQIFAERGLLPSGAVATVELQQVIEAPSAYFTFLRLSYTSRCATDAPTALFLKTYKPHVREEYGANEVAFYRSLAPTVERLPIVRCYDAFIDPDNVCAATRYSISPACGTSSSPSASRPAHCCGSIIR